MPHKKISVIEASVPGGVFESSVKELLLSDDTAFSKGFEACHDIEIFMPRKLGHRLVRGRHRDLGRLGSGEPDDGQRDEAHTHLLAVQAGRVSSSRTPPR